MFFAVALLQVIVYLFLMPAIGMMVDPDSPHGADSLAVAVLFAAGLLIGHAAAKGASRERSTELGIHVFTRVGSVVVIAWCVVHIILSVKYELYDRRIGTDSIALVFAGLNVYELFAIRALEVFFPYLIAISFLAYWRTRKPLALVVLLALVAAFAASGAVNSRSQAVILGFSSLIILQNILRARQIRTILSTLAIVGTVVVSLVTLSRLNQAEEVDAGDYAKYEFVKRLDGLEVISRLIRASGVEALGTDAQSLLSPIIAAIPVLDQATELKELALTTIKANILQNEFSSDERDVNSFVITDAYYTGGLLGVLIVGWVLGRLARVVDARIGAARSKYVHLLLVAAVCNGVALEREAIGILLGTLRDAVLLVGLMALLCEWRRWPAHHRSQPATHPVTEERARAETPAMRKGALS